MFKLFSLVQVLIISFPLNLLAGNYNYSYWGESLHSASGMTFATYFNAQTLGVEISSPEDIVVYNDIIYLVDSSTNALTLVDGDFNYINQFTSFELSSDYINYLTDNGLEVPTSIELDGPEGLDVKASGIYIADTGNYRIVKLDDEFKVNAVFDNLEDKTFDDISFEPKKVTVDTTGRMYVVAKNVYEGIIEMNYDGAFNRFTGVNPLQLTPVEIFRRSIMTEEQIAKLQLFLPTEYTNVVINEKSFIYSTSKVSENNDKNPIQLINPKGVDVLDRDGYFPPMGDVTYVLGRNNYVIDGPSNLVDIAITKNGIFTVLDQKRSRLFTYDGEGNLLYINGDEGEQSDKFSEGVALAYFNDDLLVLDRGTKTVIVYSLTEFGALVNQAIEHHSNGEFDQAALIWEEVIKINSNYEIAYNGIGKLYLRKEMYKDAMDYFKLGHDQYYYSKAFKEYRNEILKDNFGLIVGVASVAGLTFIGLRVRRAIKKGESMLYDD